MANVSFGPTSSASEAGHPSRKTDMRYRSIDALQLDDLKIIQACHWRLLVECRLPNRHSTGQNDKTRRKPAPRPLPTTISGRSVEWYSDPQSVGEVVEEAQ